MDTTVDQIQSALDRYFAAIERVSSSGPAELKESLDALIILTQNCGDGIHPQLKHFLKNQSYEKAQQWLQSITPPAGSCGSHR